MEQDDICEKLTQELRETTFFTEDQILTVHQRLLWAYASGYDCGVKHGREQVNISISKKIRVHTSETTHLDFDSAKQAADYLGTDKSNAAKCARKGYKCKGFKINYI